MNKTENWRCPHCDPRPGDVSCKAATTEAGLIAVAGGHGLDSQQTLEAVLLFRKPLPPGEVRKICLCSECGKIGSYNIPLGHFMMATWCWGEDYVHRMQSELAYRCPDTPFPVNYPDPLCPFCGRILREDSLRGEGCPACCCKEARDRLFIRKQWSWKPCPFCGMEFENSSGFWRLKHKSGCSFVESISKKCGHLAGVTEMQDGSDNWTEFEKIWDGLETK